jgi:hypothetical protein
VDGECKGLLWYLEMGLQVCSKLLHILFEHIPLHACAQHNHVDGDGVGFGINSKHLRKAKTSVLIVYYFCNVS